MLSEISEHEESKNAPHPTPASPLQMSEQTSPVISDAVKLDVAARKFWADKVKPSLDGIKRLYNSCILPTLTECSKAGEWSHEMQFYSYNKCEAEMKMYYEDLCRWCKVERGLEAEIVHSGKTSWWLSLFTVRIVTIRFSWSNPK